MQREKSERHEQRNQKGSLDRTILTNSAEIFKEKRENPRAGLEDEKQNEKIDITES